MKKNEINDTDNLQMQQISDYLQLDSRRYDSTFEEDER